MKILFVCTGNTCRSSMAEALARHELDKRGLSGRVEVMSAGTLAFSGQPASDHAVAVMKEMDIDLNSHRSTMLSRELIESADLVLTMTARHRMEILNVCPEAESKVHTLAVYAGAGADVPDPFGGGREIYHRCADSLRGMIRLAVDRLLREKL